jgi:hypothetical protein
MVRDLGVKVREPVGVSEGVVAVEVEERGWAVGAVKAQVAAVARAPVRAVEEVWAAVVARAPVRAVEPAWVAAVTRAPARVAEKAPAVTAV